MRRAVLSLILSLIPPLVLLAAPAAAQLRAVPVAPDSEQAALRGVEVVLLNEGTEPAPAEGPRELVVTAADGTRLVLERVPAPAATIAPGGFAKARYVPVALAAAPAPAVPGRPALPLEPLAAPREQSAAHPAGSTSGFFDRFSPWEPSYFAFDGDLDTKFQISFAVQPFGGAGPLSHLRIAYTQTMFWALRQPSGPITSTTYSPEAFVQLPLDPSAMVSVGVRHDSDGDGPGGSAETNRVYLRATKRFDLGDGWQAEISPQAWLFFGQVGDSPDLADYWGHTGLSAAILQPDGLKVQLTGRGSFETGRGAAELFLSYPLARIHRDLGLYLFGQAFHGYGEAIDRYRVKDSHVRLGIAITR